MTTSRKAYSISESSPGSDLAGETAAAMAAASIVFRRTRPAYSKVLISHAKQVRTIYHIFKRSKSFDRIPVLANFVFL